MWMDSFSDIFVSRKMNIKVILGGEKLIEHCQMNEVNPDSSAEIWRDKTLNCSRSTCLFQRAESSGDIQAKVTRLAEQALER